MGLFVVGLFLYVLLVPWIQGTEPDVRLMLCFSSLVSCYLDQYRSWRQSRILSSVIPMLTGAILSGWSLLSFTLGTWSTLGYLEGTIGGKFCLVLEKFIA